MKLLCLSVRIDFIFILLIILSLNNYLFSIGKDSLMAPEILKITNKLEKNIDNNSIDLSKWKNEFDKERSLKDSIENIKEREKVEEEKKILFENLKLRFENLIVDFDRTNNLFTKYEQIEKLIKDINAIEYNDIKIKLRDIVNPTFQEIKYEKEATEIELNKYKPQFVKDINDMEQMVSSDLNESSKRKFLTKFKEKWDKYAKSQNDKLLFMMYNRFFLPKNIQSKSSNMNLILVECGKVKKGDNHITLHDFYIGETEVTQVEYQKVIGSNPSNFKFNSRGRCNPVEYVDWYDALKFCNRLSEMDGLKKCYSGIEKYDAVCDFNANGYRLPTEDEWEHAASGGNYSKGYEFSGGNYWTVAIFEEQGDRIRKKPTYVKSNRPNELGIYDMSGNVWEWCWDEYIKEFHFRNYRIIRGGGWNSPRENVRIKTRSIASPTSASNTWGFRIVKKALN